MAIFNYIITCALLAEKMKIIAIAIKISKPPVAKLNKNKLYSRFHNINIRRQFIGSYKTT